MKRLTFLAVPLLLMLMTSVVAFAQLEAVPLGTNSTPELGTFLTDPDGFTLYTFTGDTPGASNLPGQLEQFWPPLRPLADRALALPPGVSGTLTAITRGDGSPQMAFNGMPLYTFVQDTSPGVVNGQGGAGGQFFVASVEAAAATATPPAAATATPVAAATATPVAAAPATVTPVATAVVTPVVAAATPVPAPVALPAAGSPPDPAGAIFILGALGMAMLGAGALMRRRTSSL